MSATGHNAWGSAVYRSHSRLESTPEVAVGVTAVAAAAWSARNWAHTCSSAARPGTQHPRCTQSWRRTTIAPSGGKLTCQWSIYRESSEAIRWNLLPSRWVQGIGHASSFIPGEIMIVRSVACLHSGCGPTLASRYARAFVLVAQSVREVHLSSANSSTLCKTASCRLPYRLMESHRWRRSAGMERSTMSGSRCSKACRSRVCRWQSGKCSACSRCWNQTSS
mmetsp:Transcript_207/g.457  ORF Transcript_207/g.457 Transcript_207/m.457 type:complete len:222 (+) Transcript_207:169-834(+)